MSAPIQDRPTGDSLRRRLEGKSGPEFWRSLEELSGSAEFEEMLSREFPSQAAAWPDGVSRRGFLSLMGASLALGGLTACTRQPLETIVPYVDQPEQLVPGKPLYFATAITQGGYATGLVAESHMGRPTKVEGNPEHPASLGATDLFAQASLLTLYDPDRSQTVTHLGRISTWQSFLAEMRDALAAPGVRLRVLTGTVTSPTLIAAIERLLAAHPGGRWHQVEPAGRDGALRAARAAFGAPLDCRYDLTGAQVLVGLDSDLLTAGPGCLRYARDFMARRRVRAGSESMSRFYAAESSPTATGTMADHRLPLRPGQLQRVTLALAARLGVGGARAPEGLDGRLTAWVDSAAADLRRHPGQGLVAAGDSAPAAVHILAHAINEALGNAGKTVLTTDPVAAAPEPHGDSFAELVAAMAGGEVDLLLTLGVNPVYDAPAGTDILAALHQVPRRAHLGLYRDETAEFSHWHVPAAHYLESWGDGRAFDGTASLVQPLIEPLYGGKTAIELVAALVDDEQRPGRELVREEWRRRAPEGEPFEAYWRRALHDGLVAGTAFAPRPATAAPEAVAAAAAELAAGGAGGGGLELLFRPDPTIWDGSWANNGWLQECPKPLTKLTWDNAALISPALAQREGLASGDVVALTAGDRTLEAPVWVLPGHPDGAVTLHLGYGRERSGRVGTGIGVNANKLRPAIDAWRLDGVELAATGERRPLASTQLHHNVIPGNVEGEAAERRQLIRAGTFETFKEEPDFAHHLAHGPDPSLSLYPGHEYPGHAWGLAIDLGACTGCNACVVACQAENNIPVVGKEQVARGREMHWIRIDRYYQGELDDPTVHHQPVMCMHCEQAPCEVVCPVAATVHSDEGLNDMVYNRCVGTRYCSNNCPYKVRRFNFFKYTDTETPVLKLLRNPDVTVRSRGVMEKCTYCVQRINYARIEAERERREIRDGEIQTACQQVCPTRAIVFGDLNDPDSEVVAWKAQPTSYGLLSELGTRPRTSYLAKVTNPDPGLEGES